MLDTLTRRPRLKARRQRTSGKAMSLSLPKWTLQSSRQSSWTLRPEIALASLNINLLGLTLPIVTLQVYDRILTSGHMGTLNLLCMGAVIAILIEAGLRLCRAYSMGWAGASFEHAMACNAVRQALAKDIAAMETMGVAEYLHCIASIGKVRNFYSGQALATYVDLLFAVLFLAVIAAIGHELVIVPLVLLAFMSLIAWALGRKLKAALERRNTLDDGRNNFLIRMLSGVHTVKALGVESLFERRYEWWRGGATRANFDVASLNAAASDEGVVFSSAMMVAVAVAGGPMVLQGNLTLGSLVACSLLAGRVMQPVLRVMTFWIRRQEIALAYKKLNELFTQNFSETSNVEGDREGRLELQDVSFAYPSQPLTLRDVCLKLKPGDAIAISGPEGAGKKTLIKLMAGILLPTRGSVLLDGEPPSDYSSDAVTEHLAYLSADGIILRGSIYDNLSRFGRVPQDRVLEMASLLGVDDDVLALAAGYDTKLEGGSMDAITPGLRQRIAIARALAMKPRILLFNNADQGLDRDGYNRVFRLLGLLKGRVTLILASDDQNILQLANTHYHIADGLLVEGKAKGDFSRGGPVKNEVAPRNWTGG
jgi:ATP-binding cassette, subfamily C, bacterial LapB